MDFCLESVAKIAVKSGVIVGAGLVGGPVAAATVQAAFTSVSLIKNLDEKNYVNAVFDTAFLAFEVAPVAVPLATMVKKTLWDSIITEKMLEAAKQGAITRRTIAEAGVTLGWNKATRTTVETGLKKTTKKTAGEVAKSTLAKKSIEKFGKNAVYTATTDATTKVTTKKIVEEGGKEFVQKGAQNFTTTTTKATADAIQNAKSIASCAANGKFVIQNKDKICATANQMKVALT